MWASRTSANCTQCTVDSEMSKGILMSFGAFPIFLIFINLVSQKRPIVEQTGPKFGTLGYLFYSVFIGYFRLSSDQGQF